MHQGIAPGTSPRHGCNTAAVQEKLSMGSPHNAAAVGLLLVVVLQVASRPIPVDDVESSEDEVVKARPRSMTAAAAAS